MYDYSGGYYGALDGDSYDDHFNEQKEEYRVFKDDEDRARYELMLIGLWRKERKPTSSEQYDAMILKYIRG